MSIFNWIGNLFRPASDLVDELHFSGEEKGNIEVKKQELRAKMAEIEARVSTRVLDLQNAALEANMRVAVAEQQHGNWLSRSHRPLTSLCLTAILVAMGFDVIEYKPLLVQICGGFLGIYGIGRSYEKVKK